MIVALDTDLRRRMPAPPVTTSLLCAALTREGSPRRLTDLLAEIPDDAAGDASAYLADVTSARAAAARGNNPILYRAYRDVLPPRAKPDRQDLGAGTAAWFADLVIYRGGMLPGGSEFHRSIGHWNTPDQIEIFHCLSGRVLMLYTSTDHSGKSTLDYQVCVAGDHVVIPFAAWHLTVAFDGPAAVFNVYTDAGTIHPDGHTSRDAAQHAHLKYRSTPVPKIAIVDTGSGIGLSGEPADLDALTPIRRDAAPLWARALLEPAGLASFYQLASDAELAQLHEHAIRHTQHGHPEALTVGRLPTAAGPRRNTP